ncbi:hypothetical protein BBJ28_00000106 [Nothophytophthora sp. Chile5]|nr:hypothetical protein BBJ28_00000106 [Nothophytophthora sp. Chile5]
MLTASATSNAAAGMGAEIATLPLVQICRDAQDDRPARCYLTWLKSSGTSSNPDARDAVDTVTTLCRGFSGQVAALEQCLKPIVRLMGTGTPAALAALQLCRFVGDGSNLPAMVECASDLRKKRVSPSTAAQLCGKATGDKGGGNRPQTCFLAAQQKLRWMDQESQVALCEDVVVRSAIAPVDCAVEVKAFTKSLVSSSPSDASSSMFVAKLCRRITNANDVAACMRLLPVKAFTAEQALRLCAGSTMIKNHDDGNDTSHYPTSCASQARTLLQRAVSSDINRSLSFSASASAVRVCEQSTSDAPSKCLSHVQYDRALSAKLRIALCQQAPSDTPQRCLHALRNDVNAQRLEMSDAVALCSRTDSLDPAECTKEVLQAATSVAGTTAVQLCRDAESTAPARCFLAAPRMYDDELKVTLCHGARSSAPASCAAKVVHRITTQPAVKALLCRGASTSAPAICAIEAPFGMAAEDLVTLCQLAENDMPARCAQAVPLSLGVPWFRVAQVCAGATSTTPGRCLAHHIRRNRVQQRSSVGSTLVSECRSMQAVHSALEIAKVAYNCPELRPMCRVQLVLNILDQYGEAMVDAYRHQHSRGAVYVTAVFIDHHDQPHQQMAQHQPILRGSSYAAIVNGSAVFSDLLFTSAGEFVLTFRAGVGVTEEVARVLVHADEAAEALQARCHGLFDRFECSSQPLPSQYDLQHSEQQLLLLPRRFQLNAVSCQQYWLENVGGLGFRGFSRSHDAVYGLPRPLYDLFTWVVLLSFAVYHLVERADSPRIAWTLLGLREGETNRAAIRRAYHRRSLEWHPDKWHALAAALPPAWQQTLGGVYTLVTQAYDQLVAE